MAEPLPQLAGERLFIGDGGLETSLIFHQGLELPDFAAFTLLQDDAGREAVRAYKRHGADCIVAEVNNGGDFIGSVLRAVDAEVPYRTVRASRGKALRAEPVSALAEQRRLHHVGSLAELEDQLCSYVPGIGSSPDRMDALVWAVFELRGLSQASWLSEVALLLPP